VTGRGRYYRLRQGRYVPDLLQELRPVRRPNLAVLLWRWRWELMLGLGLPLAVVEIGAQLGWDRLLAMVGILGGVITTAPPARYWLISHIRCIVTAHRIRTGCAQAWIQTRYGRLPAVLLTSPRPHGERAYIWCPAGISPGDFEEARELLRSACWANDIRIAGSPRYSHIVIMDIVRHTQRRGTPESDGTDSA
jgi:hypothetical protein